MSKWWVEKPFFGRFMVCTESALSASSPVATGIYYEDDAVLIARAPEMARALREIAEMDTEHPPQVERYAMQQIARAALGDEK